MHELSVIGRNGQSVIIIGMTGDILSAQINNFIMKNMPRLKNYNFMN